MEEVLTDVITGTNGPGTYSMGVYKDYDNEGGYIISNAHTPEKIEIPVTKVWDDDDNRDGIRPPMVTLELLGDGVRYNWGSPTNPKYYVVAIDADHPNGKFTNLRKYRDHGVEIEYSKCSAIFKYL